MADMAVPSPVPKQMVCSVCGLGWERHKRRNHTMAECVELLKAELASRPVYNFGWNTAVSSPVYYHQQLGSGTTN